MENLNYELSKAIALFRTFHLNDINSKFIKSSEFQVLMIIRNSDECITSIDIAKYLNCSKVYISKVVNVLIEKQYIVKQQNNQDHRESFLLISHSGEELVKKYMDKYMETIAYLSSVLGEEKARILLALLNESTSILIDYQHKEKQEVL